VEERKKIEIEHYDKKAKEWIEEDLERAKNYFNKVEANFFHLISWVSFPFLRFSFGKSLLKFLEFIDKILLKLPFLRKYAFKVVFIFSKPKEQYDKTNA